MQEGTRLVLGDRLTTAALLATLRTDMLVVVRLQLGAAVQLATILQLEPATGKLPIGETEETPKL